MWLADLHVHSSFSDGRLTIPELVDNYGQRGFGCIAITDHVCEEHTLFGKAARYLNQCLTRDRFPLYKAILKTEIKRAWKQYNMLVLPGFELSKNSISNHRSAHILTLDISDYFSADGDIFSICERAKKQNALTIAAHPVSTRKLEHQTYYLWGRKEQLSHHIDAWEVASGRHFSEEVFSSGLPMVASSDLHRPEQIYSWKTSFEGPRTSTSLFSAIRRQDLEFVFYGEEKLEYHSYRRPRSVDFLKPLHHLGDMAHLQKV